MIQDPFCYFNGETKRYSTLHLHVSDLQFQRSYGVFKVIATGGYSDTLDSVTGPPNFLVLNLPWRSTAEGSVMVSRDHLHARCRKHFAQGDGYILN